MRALVVGPLFFVVGAACEPPVVDAGPEAGCAGFFGDEDAEPVVELYQRTLDGGIVPIAEGGEVPLILPPQGGKVILVGVRAKNVDLCALSITAAVHDECTAVDGGFGRIVGREGRPLHLEAADDGWAYPIAPDTLTNWANVPMCPNTAFPRDMDGEPYLLRIRIVDGSVTPRRTALAEAHITPVCAEPRNLAECQCQCDKDYVLGQQCGDDADGGRGDDGDVDDPPPGTCPRPPDDAGSPADAGDGGG
jgi:hypothetical protein